MRRKEEQSPPPHTHTHYLESKLEKKKRDASIVEISVTDQHLCRVCVLISQVRLMEQGDRGGQSPRPIILHFSPQQRCLSSCLPEASLSLARAAWAPTSAILPRHLTGSSCVTQGTEPCGLRGWWRGSWTSSDAEHPPPRDQTR